jgi:hypothetical protein
MMEEVERMTIQASGLLRRRWKEQSKSRIILAPLIRKMNQLATFSNHSLLIPSFSEQHGPFFLLNPGKDNR